MLDLDGARRRRRARCRGEGALLAALGAHRTGRMGDIVATIQAEQDRVIRVAAGRRARRPGRPGHRQDGGGAAPRGVPALHPPRAARAQRRARRRAQPAVPALHRAGAALARRDRRRAVDARRAVPGRRRATATERPRWPRSRATCGWRTSSRHAVRDRQRVPAGPAARRRRRVRPSCCAPAVVARGPRPGPRRPAGRTTRRATTFVADVLDDLAGSWRGRTRRRARRRGPRRPARRAAPRARGAARGQPAAGCRLTAQRLARRPLRASRPARRGRDGILTRRERTLLLREPGRAVDAGRRAAARRGRRAARRPTTRPLPRRRPGRRRRDAGRSGGAGVRRARCSTQTGDGDPDMRRRRDARRPVRAAGGPAQPLAERAASDRTWAFGHVVVDEAQELSPMAVAAARCAAARRGR